MNSLKIGKFWDYRHFRCQFEISYGKQHYSFQKSLLRPTGQRVSAMLSISNIQIRQNLGWL